MKFEKYIKDLKVIFITADTGEGKTRLGYRVCEGLKDTLPIYIFKHPLKEKVKKLGFKNMYSIDELENLNNICLWIDEPQIIFPKYEKRGNIILNKILSLSRQKDITLIMSTSDTRYITASEEFYVTTYLIKKIDYAMIKRGSKIKDIITNLATITPEGYLDNIKPDEFVFYNRKLKELNGKHRFKTPSYFDESLSKPFQSIPNINS